MTPRDAILRASRQFRAAGVPDPAEDAALLLSMLTGRAPLVLRLDMDTELEPELLSRYEALCGRRAAREPLQYLTGEARFMGRDFAVSPGVLIPRPDTEIAAGLARDLLLKQPVPTALDLCCGSGCIAVSLALEVPGSAVTAADLSPEALSLTALNARRLNAPVRAVSGDLWNAVAGERFGVIVSNPPYIPRAECEILQPEVLREPRMALDGGLDGLDFYRRIVAGAPEHLLPGGWLVLEVGSDQAGAVRSLMTTSGFTCVAVHPDLRGMDRALTGCLSG